MGMYMAVTREWPLGARLCRHLLCLGGKSILVGLLEAVSLIKGVAFQYVGSLEGARCFPMPTVKAKDLAQWLS